MAYHVWLPTAKIDISAHHIFGLYGLVGILRWNGNRAWSISDSRPVELDFPITILICDSRKYTSTVKHLDWNIETLWIAISIQREIMINLNCLPVFLWWIICPYTTWKFDLNPFSWSGTPIYERSSAILWIYLKYHLQYKIFCGYCIWRDGKSSC